MPDNKSKNAEQATQEASPWVDRVARTGYATKGAVYLVVGALAFAAAIGMGGRTTDPPGALSTIGIKPLGWLVLGFVTIGLTHTCFGGSSKRWLIPREKAAT